MRNQFRYQRPELKNNLFYLVLVTAFLAWLEWMGRKGWDSFIHYYSPFSAFVGFGFGFYLLIFWGVGLFYILVDLTQKPQWIYRNKIQTGPLSGEPLKSKSIKPSLKKAIQRAIQNQFLGTLPAVIAVYFLLEWRRGTLVDPVPSAGRILLDLGGVILIEEIAFYFCHLLLHQKFLFRKVHRIHHEFQEPIGIATHYVHFFEHWFGNLFPIFLGPLILGTHPITLFLWMMIAVINALHTHSNYHFSWMSYSVFHDFHHYNFKGNYGVLGLLDVLFKTQADFKRIEQKSMAIRTGREPEKL